MIELNKENFDAEVLQASGLVLVDFWSEKCEPCMALMPEVVKLAEKNAGRAKFCKLDTAGNKRLAISQKVLGMPTVVFYKDGEKVFTFGPAEIDADGIDAVQAKLDELA
ncbi:MAG: thioredoxin family protein [Defluviitaleaceae bacterium]|nr:thioredoxin family protein [Defluviitaleaceae bacterium]MCL2238620.1 thioredoxin family protein [Defluviitaleaceae bacterium]